jgi:hypothetical protein
MVGIAAAAKAALNAKAKVAEVIVLFMSQFL